MSKIDLSLKVKKNKILNNKILGISLIIFMISLCSFPARSQVNSVYFFEMTGSAGDKTAVNDNNRGDNPFNQIRAKWFINSWLTDKLGVFVKVLYDDGIDVMYDDKIRIDGAYFLYSPTSKLNIKAGKIPSTLGSFPERNYLEKNDLIGSPLMYQYRTGLPKGTVIEAQDLLSLKGAKNGNNIIYEACWNNGVEVSGNNSWIGYKLAVTDGSLVNPPSNSNDGFQFMGKLSVNKGPGIKAGIGYGISSYLKANSTNIPSGTKTEDYRSTSIITDLEYTAGYLETHAEFIHNTYDIGSNRDEISLDSFFVEGKYKIKPRFYIAARWGRIIFEKINAGNNSKETWDHNITRFEFGGGYKYSRKTILKAVAQYNYYEDDVMDKIIFYAFQIKTEL